MKMPIHLSIICGLPSHYRRAELNSCNRLCGLQSLKYHLASLLQNKSADAVCQVGPHFIMARFEKMLSSLFLS